MSNIPEDVKPWPLIGYAPEVIITVKDTHKYIGILEGKITKYREALEKIAAYVNPSGLNPTPVSNIATEALKQ